MSQEPPLAGFEPRLAPVSRRILYFAPVGGAFERLLDDLDRREPGRVVRDDDLPRVDLDGARVEWCAAALPHEALALLDTTYINALIIDLRCDPDHAADFERRVAAAMQLLQLLDRVDDVEARYGFHRILVLLSGPRPTLVDRTIARLGMEGIGHVARQYDWSSPEQDAAYAERVVLGAIDIIAHRSHGGRALCAAGGGITGIYFELGALKCLEDCLPAQTLNTFDMYFGISAGAVVTSFLATGYSVDEIMAAIAGVPGGRIPDLDLNVLSLKHLNFPDIRQRCGEAAKTALGALRSLLLRGERPSLARLIFEYGELIGPLLSSEHFGRMIEEILTRPGATNDFRDLPHRLFIGATDQDARRHVLFGADGFDHVPIHRAVQGSLSFNPAFAATPIEGRYYEDGAVTRTSNFGDAIRRGAKFVFVVDPFVPYVSRMPGAAAQRGILYNIDQNVRTISYTRFEAARNHLMRKHPDVSAYTFLPSNTQRRLLTVNPMDHRPFLPIWRGAYLSVLQRIHHLRHRLHGDLRAYGLTLVTDRADAIADQLQATADPQMADFYPDRRIALRRPPLVAHRRRDRSRLVA